MNYFQLTQQEQYLKRRCLLFTLFAKFKKDKITKIHPYVVVLEYLHRLQEQAFELEHYEVLEVIKIIINNKEIDLKKNSYEETV